jgi:hypothetical protein
MSDQLADIGAVRQQLLAQDNLATAHPIFYVMEKERIYGLDSDHAERFVWCHPEMDGEYSEADKSSEAFAVGGDEEVPACDWYQVYYKDRDRVVQPFLTRTAAEDYIANYAYNHREPFVYVGTAYRNPEWQAVRALLMIAENPFHPIAEGEPDSDRPVLVLVKDGSRRHWTRAEWVARFGREDHNDFDGNLDFKDDTSETGYWPEDWYEAPVGDGYDTQKFAIPFENVLGWQELPPLPELPEVAP